jgi:cellulose binding protein with CBM2 domain
VGGLESPVHLFGESANPSGWYGIWTQSGHTVTVTNESWNANVATGASISVGATFTNSGPNVNPSTFTVNGVPCNGGGCGEVGPVASITRQIYVATTPQARGSRAAHTATPGRRPGSKGPPHRHRARRPCHEQAGGRLTRAGHPP